MAVRHGVHVGTMDFGMGRERWRVVGWLVMVLLAWDI